MEMTQFVLMLFIWPAGQAEDKPIWTNESYLTLAECKADAIVAKSAILKKYGDETHIEDYCFSINDRLTQ